MDKYDVVLRGDASFIFIEIIFKIITGQEELNKFLFLFYEKYYKSIFEKNEDLVNQF